MARCLLDTDAIVDYLAGIASSVAFIQQVDARGDLLCVCDVVVAEVYAGLRPQDRDKPRRLLSSFNYLPTTFEIAQQAGEWRYSYARQGVSLSTTDTLIAATAFFHDAGIITGNTGDYPMPEVALLPLPRVKQ